LEKKTRFIF